MILNRISHNQALLCPVLTFLQHLTLLHSETFYNGLLKQVLDISKREICGYVTCKELTACMNTR